MPSIPLKISEQNNSAGAPNRSYSDVKASAAMFGGGVGEAMAGLGSVAADLASTGLKIAREQDNEDRKERVAQASAQTDLVTPALNNRLQAPEDGSGVAQKTYTDQMEIINAEAERIFPGDAKGASMYRQSKLAEIKHTRDSNVNFEFTQKANYNKQQADNGLNVVYNKLRMDPSIYDTAVADGNALIDASSAIPASEKAAYKVTFAQNAANTRMEGRLFAAKTIDDVKSVEGELSAEDSVWQSRLTPDQFKQLVQKADNQKKVFQTKANSEITTELQSLRVMSDDKEAAPIPQERMENMRRKIESNGSEVSTVAMAEFARLQRDEQIKASTRGMPAYQIAILKEKSKGGIDQSYPGLPPEMSANVNKVAGMFPGVSAGYLGATATIEYGGKFKKDGTTDYGYTNPGSDGKGTATGVYQFIEKTWTDVTGNPGVQAVLKANGFDKIDRDTRKDPLASTIAAAALASQNKTILENTLHRQVSDSELYMAHFMGADTAAKFIGNYVTNRDLKAADMDPKAAAANKDIYYTKDGRARSVAEVYDIFNTRFTTSPSQVQYGDAKRYEKLYDGAVKAQNENPISYAANNGTHTVVPLDQPGAWEARGSTFRDIGTYYRIADADNKPLDTATEVPQLKKMIADGSAEQVAQLLTGIGQMDKTANGAASAALTQLGEKNTAIGVAAQLMQGSAPDMATATTVIRGQKLIDTGNKTALGGKDEADNAFNKVVGTSLNFLDPKAREALQRAAEAHYAQTARGTEANKFDTKAFTASINAVVGGADRIADVNGARTVLPKGVNESTFNKAVDNLTGPDLVALSVGRKGQPNGMAPVYSDGSPVKPTDIAVQAKLRYVGGDTYEVYMADNKRLVTPDVDPASGAAMPYRMKFDAKVVTDMATRKTINPLSRQDPKTAFVRNSGTEVMQ